MARAVPAFYPNDSRLRAVVLLKRFDYKTAAVARANPPGCYTRETIKEMILMIKIITLLVAISIIAIIITVKNNQKVTVTDNKHEAGYSGARGGIVYDSGFIALYDTVFGG